MDSKKKKLSAHIRKGNFPKLKKLKTKFSGTVVDTGAARSCIGMKQAKALAKIQGANQEVKKSNVIFKFGDITHKSLGTMQISIPTPNGNNMTFRCDIVPADIPLLLGLDVMRREGLIINVRDLELEHNDWSMPMKVRNNHLIISWLSNVYYSKAQLKKLHRHFRHPGAKKLYQLLKRVDPENVTGSTLTALKEIQSKCEPCNVITRKQLSFQVGNIKEDDLIFNREISMDLFKIEKDYVLHVIDIDTHFSAAEFLKNGMSSNSVWDAFLKCWALVYAGMPDVMFCDHGSAFTSHEWKKLAEENGVVMKLTGVQHHNGIGLCERYHGPLRTIYRRIKKECPDIENNLALKSAVKAMNDTVGPEGLVPSLLAFGIHPRYIPAGLDPDLPNQRQRHEAMKLAREEFSRISNRLRIQHALRSNVPNSADKKFEVGDLVRVYRDELKGYTDPVPIISIDESNKMVSVDNNGTNKWYAITQVKLFEGYEKESDKIVEDVGTALGPWSVRYWKEKTGNDGPEEYAVYITEIIEKGDPRYGNTKMKDAIRKEIEGLLERGTFKIVVREEIPNNPNILGGRFVLAVKNPSTKEEVYKARFVVQGHRDRDKAILVHASPNLRQESVRLLFAIASIMGFSVWTQDISQAYLQGSTELMREIFIEPSREFQLSPNQLFKLMKPLYGLSDSGDRWHYTLRKHFIEDLSMKPTTGDLSLYVKHISGQLSGLSGVYVDDLIEAGSKEFSNFTKQTGQRFDAKARKLGNAKFMGMEFSQREGLDLSLSMREYISKLRHLPVPCSFEQFRSMRSKLLWTVNCRPDVACAIAKLSQITEKGFDLDSDPKLTNKIIRHLKKHSVVLHYPKLDRKTLHLRTYADSSHANNKDLSTQLGFIICLCDSKNNVAIISYRSYKCRRKTRSALASECHAFADAFDYSYLLKYDIEQLLQQRIPLQMFTDSKSLFDVIVRASMTSERRLMIDISATREAYERHEIADIGLIGSEHNLADCMTKIMAPKQLLHVLSTKKLNHPVKQYVIRKSSEKVYFVENRNVSD